MKESRRIQLGLGATFAGLVVALICTVSVTPATFVMFVAIGVPLILVGMATYVHSTWKGRRGPGAAGETSAEVDTR